MNDNKNKKRLNFITKVAIFSAISTVLYYLKFPLPFIFPSFLEVQFSNLPALLGSFVLGPLGGVIIVLVRFLIKLATTHTFGVGELSDLIIGLGVVLSASIYYKERRTKKSGIIALIISSIVWVLLSIISNAFIILPTYVKVIGEESVLASLSIIKGVNESNYILYYVLFAVIPFNILLSVIVCIVTFLVYKRVSVVFKNDFFSKGMVMDQSVLVISDSFKGTLSSKDVGETICSSLRKKGITADYIPISDGGEGFLDAMYAGKKNLYFEKETCVDCFFREIEARYLYDEKSCTAYFELAEVVGIKNLKIEELSPFKASTYGLGLLIKKCIDKHQVKKVVIGIGGSASTDAGTGMLEALGVKFYDENHKLLQNMNNEMLPLVKSIDFSSAQELSKKIIFLTLTDVTNPLFGPNGAAFVYGPQKGANEEDVKKLEENIIKYNNVVIKVLGHDYSLVPGAGAAGGVGFGTNAFLKANLVSGIETLLEEINFARLVKKYSQIITGEGRLDSQSFQGKVISGILNYKPENVLFVVAVSLIEDEKYNVLSIVPTVATKEESMQHPKEMLAKLIDEKYIYTSNNK